MKTKIYLKSEGFKLSSRMSITKLVDDKLELFSAKGSSVAFQMVVVSDEDTAVNVSKEPFISHDLDTSNVRIAATSKLPITVNHIAMTHGGNPGYFADAFITDKIVEMRQDIPASIFFSIDIPKDFSENSLEIELKAYHNSIFLPEKEIFNKTLKVDILKYTMPDYRDYKIFLDLWQQNTMMARSLKLPLFGDEHFEYIEKYIKTLAELGQKCVTAIVSEAPWSGQRCFMDNTGGENLFEYSMISVKNTKKGFEYDFSVLKRYIDLCFKYGIDKEIEIFGLTGIWRADKLGFGKIADDFVEAIRVRYEDLDGTYKYMDKGADIESYVKAIEQYFIDQKLIDIVKVIADEPEDKKVYKESLTVLHKITPSFKYKSALASAGFLDEIYEDVSDFSPSFEVLCKEFKPFEKKMELKVKDNKKYLWYVCLTPTRPNTFVFSEPIESRIIGLLTYLFKADGFLRWSYYGFLKDPIASSTFRGFPGGDCNLIYFDKQGNPALSLRYKALKRGIEDYELIVRLAEKGKTEELKTAFEMMLTKKRYDKLTKEMDKVLNSTNDDKVNLDMPDTTTVSYSDYDKARKYMMKVLIED
ncbi:MAG: DUF4091 domain-containing protein [Clostridia bacterium]